MWRRARVVVSLYRHNRFVAIATGSGAASLQTPDTHTHTGKSDLIKRNSDCYTSIDMVWFGFWKQTSSDMQTRFVNPADEDNLSEFLTNLSQLFDLPPHV